MGRHPFFLFSRSDLLLEGVDVDLLVAGVEEVVRLLAAPGQKGRSKASELIDTMFSSKRPINAKSAYNVIFGIVSGVKIS